MLELESAAHPGIGVKNSAPARQIVVDDLDHTLLPERRIVSAMDCSDGKCFEPRQALTVKFRIRMVKGVEKSPIVDNITTKQESGFFLEQCKLL